MVPIHRRKLVVQKAQEGKFFDFPETQGKSFQAPKSLIQFEKYGKFPYFTTSFGGTREAIGSLGKGTLKTLRSPFGIASLIAGAGGLNYLTSDRDELKQKRDDLIYQLGRREREKKAEEFVKSETGPAIPGSELDLRRKADLEREAMGDVGQYDRNVQNVQPPTVTGQPLGTNQVQAGIDAQKNTLQNADAAALKLDLLAAKQGRLAQLQGVKDLVKDIMGEEGYDKAGNLMLLQIASNLLSGRTDKPGFAGFLDVLGQAGQKVIPMAIALERERQKDELDLTKSILSQLGKDKKLEKIEPPKQRALLLDNVTGQKKIRFVSPTDDGKFMVFENVKGKSTPYKVDPSQILNFFKLEENPIERRKYVADYRAKAAGDKVVESVLEIVKRNPSASGAFGGYNLIIGRSLAQINQLMGGQDYADSINRLVDELSADFPDAIDPNKSKADAKDTASGIKAANEIFEELRKISPLLNSTNETLRDQAQLRTFELIAVYSLAQVNKRQDRIAVSDVNNARDVAGGLITFVPFFNPSNEEIIARYSTLRSQFKTGMESTVNDAFVAGIDLSDIDEKYNKAFNIESPTKKIVENTTKTNQNDFSKIFSKEKIGGALLR